MLISRTERNGKIYCSKVEFLSRTKWSNFSGSVQFRVRKLPLYCKPLTSETVRYLFRGIPNNQNVLCYHKVPKVTTPRK